MCSLEARGGLLHSADPLKQGHCVGRTQGTDWRSGPMGEYLRPQEGP